jgi:hypothetical protein
MSAQFPNVPALPGVPPLARLTTAAQTFAGASLAGETQALASQLGLPPTVTFGTDSLYSGLDLQPLTSPPTSSQGPDAGSTVPAGALPKYSITTAETVTIGPFVSTMPDGTTVTDVTTSTDSFNVSQAISPDSVVELDFNADSQVNTHPVEPGTNGPSVGFSAYNRVQDPVNIRLLLACMGKNMTRKAFVSTLQNLREGTQLVTISTPDASYPNMTLKGYGYKKTAERGAVTIWADTHWTEERSSNVVISSPPTAQPQGEATASLGSVQPATATPQQQASISNPPVPPTTLPADYASTAPPSGDAF